MIRWSYLLPRLAAVLVVLALVHFGGPPLLRWTLVASMESTTGTEIEVADVWTSLARGEMRIGGLQMARSQSSATNVVQFDSAKLTLNVSALAHQRCVIDDAQIRGLKFDTPRSAATADSHPIEITAPDVNHLAQLGREQMQQWLRQLTTKLECRVEDEFESIPLARQLAEQWPEDYRQLQQQARQLRSSAAQLQQSFSEIASQAGTLNQISELRKRWPEVLQLRDEMAALHQRAAQLALQIELDRRSIDTALQHDRENLREKMRLTQLNGGQLSDCLLNDYLLNAEVHRWWVQLKPWLEFASWLTDAPNGNELGNRGYVVQYETTVDQPGFLIRQASLDGELNLAGHQVAFVGEARDLLLPGQRGTSRHAHATRMKLVTRGPFTAQFYAKIDTVDGTPRQQIALRCDDLPLPARRWGGAKQLSLSVAPGTVQIQASLIASQGRVDGRLRVTQQKVGLAVNGPTNSAYGPLLKPFAEAAGTIDRIDLLVDLSGTLDAPRWQLDSDLGRQLQTQWQQVAEQLVREQAAQLMAAAEHRLANELAELQQQLAGERAALEQQLGAGEQLLSRLPEPVASRIQPLQDLWQRF